MKQLCSAMSKHVNEISHPEVGRAAKAFVRARGAKGSIHDYIKYCDKWDLKPHEALDIVMMWAGPDLRRWLLASTPKKRNLRAPVTGATGKWTTSRYKNIQNVERRNLKAATLVTGDGETDRSGVFYDARGLRRYMTAHALRAPARPLRAPDSPLYRGVMLTKLQLKTLTTLSRHTDRGFMAFTRDGEHAADFGSRSTQWGGPHFVLFRLHLADVARGTPWIWYAGPDEERQAIGSLACDDPWACPKAVERLHFQGWDVAAHGGGEQETLLPPGTLTVKRVTRIDNAAFKKLSASEQVLVPPGGRPATTVTWVDVAYTPDARYAMRPRRKGTFDNNANILWEGFAPQLKRDRSNAPSQAAKLRAKRARR